MVRNRRDPEGVLCFCRWEIVITKVSKKGGEGLNAGGGERDVAIRESVKNGCDGFWRNGEMPEWSLAHGLFFATAAAEWRGDIATKPCEGAGVTFYDRGCHEGDWVLQGFRPLGKKGYTPRLANYFWSLFSKR
jgi:hypothetical protein